MKTVMISIKPRHLKDMREGRKLYELRKTRPNLTPPFRVLCCESGTGGEVRAAFTCDACPDMTWKAPTVTAALACIKPEEVRKYRGDGKLYGWRVKDFEDWAAEGRTRHAIDFGLTRPPQSWCYVEGD